MEVLKIFSKFLIVIAFSVMSIICLYSVATQNKNKSKFFDRINRNYDLNKYIYVIANNNFCVYGCELILLIATCFFVFQNIISFYEIFKSADYIDFKSFYLASKMTIEGTNPYNLVEYTKSFLFPFLYPPNIIPLILPLSLFEYSTSYKIFFTFNLISVFILIAGALTLLKNKSRNNQIILIIFCLLIFGVLQGLRMGQLTTILSAGIIWAFIFARKNNNILAGFLLGIVAIKPTLVILFLAYFLLKRRYLLIGICLMTSMMLFVIGLLIIHSSITDFLSMYKSGYDLAFSIIWNSPFTSPTRIDVEVIGARLFSSNVVFAKLISVAIQLITISFSFVYFYKQQILLNWSKRIYLSDASLIACLSIFNFYSQFYSSSTLVLVVPFLLNYLSSEISNKRISNIKVSAWLLSIFCFSILSPVSYMLLNYIAFIPSYALLVLTISIYILVEQPSSICQYQR